MPLFLDRRELAVIANLAREFRRNRPVHPMRDVELESLGIIPGELPAIMETLVRYKFVEIFSGDDTPTKYIKILPSVLQAMRRLRKLERDSVYAERLEMKRLEREAAMQHDQRTWQAQQNHRAMIFQLFSGLLQSIATLAAVFIAYSLARGH